MLRNPLFLWVSLLRLGNSKCCLDTKGPYPAKWRWCKALNLCASGDFDLGITGRDEHLAIQKPQSNSKTKTAKSAANSRHSTILILPIKPHSELKPRAGESGPVGSFLFLPGSVSLMICCIRVFFFVFLKSKGCERPGTVGLWYFDRIILWRNYLAKIILSRAIQVTEIVASSTTILILARVVILLFSEAYTFNTYQYIYQFLRQLNSREFS